MFVHAAQRLGYRSRGARPRRRLARPAASPQRTSAPTTSTSRASAQLAACSAARHHRVRERAGRRAAPRWPRSGRWRPAAEAVAMCQDRAREKAHFARCGVPCAPHAVIDDEAAISVAVRRAAARHPEDRAPRLRRQGPAPRRRPRRARGGLATRSAACPACSSSAAARRRDQRHRRPRRATATSSALPVQRTCTATASSPSPRCRRRTSTASAAAARPIAAARAIAAALDYVGVLCVEFFVLDDGSLVANEMAPRPHNSGHYSIDACDVSQFELQVRAMAGAAAGRAAPALAGGDAQPAGRPVVRDGAARPTRLARRAGAARRAPAPVRQGAGAAGPQDGPPDPHRRDAAAARCAWRATPRSASACAPW